MTSEAQTRAHVKYVRNNMRRFTLQCHNDKEADIIGFLEGKGNVNGYLKELIREQIAKEG